MTAEKKEEHKIETIADFIKVKRAESGLSQGQLGKLLGFTNGQFISNIERGLCAIPLEKCKPLCEALKINKGSLKSMMVYEYSQKLSKVF